MQSLQSTKRRLHGNSFSGLKHENYDLRSMQAFGSKWSGCSFEDTIFDLAVLQSAHISLCSFTRCGFVGTDFSGGQIESSRFVGCSMHGVKFEAALLKDSRFENCEMVDALFFNSILSNVTFENCNMHAADLRFLKAFGTDFSGSNLWNAAVRIGCQFFNGTFDERQCKLFMGIVARRYPSTDIAKQVALLAGNEAKIVDRLMRESE